MNYHIPDILPATLQRMCLSLIIDADQQRLLSLVASVVRRVLAVRVLWRLLLIMRHFRLMIKSREPVDRCSLDESLTAATEGCPGEVHGGQGLEYVAGTSRGDLGNPGEADIGLGSCMRFVQVATTISDHVFNDVYSNYHITEHRTRQRL